MYEKQKIEQFFQDVLPSWNGYTHRPGNPLSKGENTVIMNKRKRPPLGDGNGNARAALTDLEPIKEITGGSII